MIDLQGNQSVPTGLGTTFQITAVAHHRAVVTSLSADQSFATFELTPNQGPNSYFEIWYNSPVTVNPLAGTGFNDGTRILLGSPTTSLANVGNMTVTLDGGGNRVHQAFDQFGPNDYPSVTSDVGSGSLLFGSNISTFDPAFFQSPLTNLIFNTSFVVPFNETDPSQAFVGQAGGGAPG